MASYLPVQGLIYDLGCGHGLFANYLALQSPARKVIGIDHDQFRIAVAQQAAEHIANAEYRAGDFAGILQDLHQPPAAIVILDALHYLPLSQQEGLLAQAFHRLQSRGILLIREVDTQAGIQSRYNRLHEKIMTATGFTQGTGLNFRDPEEWSSLLHQLGFKVSSIPCSRFPFADRLFIGTRD